MYERLEVVFTAIQKTVLAEDKLTHITRPSAELNTNAQDLTMRAAII